MHKRSLLVGFGLGLVLAGIIGMMGGAHNRWHDRDAAPVLSEAGGRSADQVAYQRTSGYVHHGIGMVIPMMIVGMLCFVPLMFLVFMSVFFRIFRRIRHRMHRRWHHGHGGAPTYYV